MTISRIVARISLAVLLVPLLFCLFFVALLYLKSFFIHYEPIMQLADERTGLVVELARTYPDVADKYYYSVYVYGDRAIKRRYSEFRPPIMTVVANKDAPTLRYDGECYIMIAKDFFFFGSPESQ